MVFNLWGMTPPPPGRGLTYQIFKLQLVTVAKLQLECSPQHEELCQRVAALGRLRTPALKQSESQHNITSSTVRSKKSWETMTVSRDTLSIAIAVG